MQSSWNHAWPLEGDREICYSLTNKPLLQTFKDKFSPQLENRKRNEGRINREEILKKAQFDNSFCEASKHKEDSKREWKSEGKRKEYIRIPANRETRGFDRGSNRRSPPKGIPGRMRNPPPPIFLASYRSARKGVQGPRRKNRDVKRDYDWTRFPCPLRAKLPTVFPLEARQIILETRSFDRFVRRASIFPSAPPIRVRASDGGAANLAQPRISMRTLPATYLWTSAVTFEKGSRRYESSRKILVERERERWSGGRSRRTAWACRFVFEEISLRIDKIGDDNKKFPSFEIKWFDRCFLSLFDCSKRRKEESLRKKNESSTRSIEGNEV